LHCNEKEGGIKMKRKLKKKIICYENKMSDPQSFIVDLFSCFISIIGALSLIGFVVGFPIIQCIFISFIIASMIMFVVAIFATILCLKLAYHSRRKVLINGKIKIEKKGVDY